MPRRAARPCSAPGCPNLVRGRGVRYCAEHLAEHRKKQDAERGSASERGYGPQWQKARDAYLKEHPWCQRCGKKRAIIVHHIVRKRDGGSDEPLNLLALCKLCHTQVHAQEEGLFQRVRE